MYHFNRKEATIISRVIHFRFLLKTKCHKYITFHLTSASRIITAVEAIGSISLSYRILDLKHYHISYKYIIHYPIICVSLVRLGFTVTSTCHQLFKCLTLSTIYRSTAKDAITHKVVKCSCLHHDVV